MKKKIAKIIKQLVKFLKNSVDDELAVMNQFYAQYS